MCLLIMNSTTKDTLFITRLTLKVFNYEITSQYIFYEKNHKGFSSVQRKCGKIIFNPERNRKLRTCDD